MDCVNRGPWHTGLSDEACSNAGGEWFRTPCLTLKACIDDRPPRFDLHNSMEGSCQDTLGTLDTAFVTISTDLYDPGTTNNTKSCLHFCQSLPGYSNHRGMMIDEGSANDYCVCLYENHLLPGSDTLPEYATRSPPAFSLKSSTGEFALGLSRSNCTSADKITIEVQKYEESSPLQQFLLSYTGNIVSAMCPERVLTAKEDGVHAMAKVPGKPTGTLYTDIC